MWQISLFHADHVAIICKWIHESFIIVICQYIYVSSYKTCRTSSVFLTSGTRSVHSSNQQKRAAFLWLYRKWPWVKGWIQTNTFLLARHLFKGLSQAFHNLMPQYAEGIAIWAITVLSMISSYGSWSNHTVMHRNEHFLVVAWDAWLLKTIYIL